MGFLSNLMNRFRIRRASKGRIFSFQISGDYTTTHLLDDETKSLITKRIKNSNTPFAIPAANSVLNLAVGMEQLRLQREDNVEQIGDAVQSISIVTAGMVKNGMIEKNIEAMKKEATG